MYFANPIALWFLLSLAVPIIIHLFNFRRFKRVYFSNVAMLKEIKIDTQSTNRLKHLLVLLARMLAIFFIVFAFAQPYFKGNSKLNKGTSAVSIFLDNSFSMNAENKNGNLLDAAKKAAKEIALAYKPSDKFQLLTNDFEGRHQRFYSRDEFLNLLDNVQSSAESKNINQILKRQQDALKEETVNEKKIYLIADFQKSLYKTSKARVDSAISMVIVPLVANETTNIYIDSIWFENPNHALNAEEKINLRLKASGNDRQTFENLPIKLYINNEQKALASFTIENNNSTLVQLSFTNRRVGEQQCRIELQDFPINFDNNFYFNYQVHEKVNTLCINDGSENNYLTSLFENDAFCNIQQSNLSSINIAEFKKYDFIILNAARTLSSGFNQEIEKFMSNGGTILLVPNATIDLNTYNQLLDACNAGGFTGLDTVRTKVERINLQHSIYKDVFEAEKLKRSNLDLPLVFKHYGHKRITTSRSETMLQLQNGDDFLFSVNKGAGRLFVTTSPLEPSYSNFVKHALFVPSIYKAAVTSLHQSDLYHTIGNTHVIQIKKANTASEAVYHLKNETNKFDVIPAIQTIDGNLGITLHNQLKESGNYLLKNESEICDVLSFNYNQLESEFSFYSASEMKDVLEDAGIENFTVFANKGKSLTQSVKEENTGISLWKSCVWLALAFLLAEAMLLSKFKISDLLKSFKRKSV